MGLLYLANLFLHLLFRSCRPAAWHNALRQGALTAELLVWALQRLVNDFYRGATGKESLSLAQVTAAEAAGSVVFPFLGSVSYSFNSKLDSRTRGTQALAGS
jgi:hypothetical protein